MKNIISKYKVPVLTAIFSIAFILVGHNMFRIEPNLEGRSDFHVAEVIAITGSRLDEFSLDGGISTIANKSIDFSATLRSGAQKGQIIQANQYVDFLYPYQPKDVESGDRIVLTFNPSMMETGLTENNWSFVEHDRLPRLLTLCGGFFLLIILIGRGKGVGTLFSLLTTTGVIFGVYIPTILLGINIYLSTSIIAMFIIVSSLLMINGANKKTLCAILGNMGGVLVAGLLAYAMNQWLGLSGIVDEEYVYLMSMENAPDMNLRAMVWGGIVIGSLGAIMDVAMSIASAMQELSEKMETKTYSSMLQSGMNIGQDAIGTMTNTLILAYIGGSLATVLLLMSHNNSVLYLFNLEMIIVEVMQAVIGSMGILFAVPVTALLGAYFFTRPESELRENSGDIERKEDKTS